MGKVTTTKYTCEGCADYTLMNDGFYSPPGWVKVQVNASVKVKGDKFYHNEDAEIYFCETCWGDGVPPRNLDTPTIIKKFFAWAKLKKHGV